MRNSAELALAEFNAPNIQLLVKDDGGTSLGAQQAAQQALDEGAEIILGPLFAQSVQAAGQVARTRGVPVIAFSTDTSAAARGVNLLSFLPESDVNRIVNYAFANGKKSFAALVQDNAYGQVIEAAFKEAVARRGGARGRDRALRIRPDQDADADQVDRAIGGPGRRDPDRGRPRRRSDDRAAAGGERREPEGAPSSSAPGCGTTSASLPIPRLSGGWYPAPDPAGFAEFLQPLPPEIRTGSGPHRDAVL